MGLDHHTELWVPAEELEEFNLEIINTIKVVDAYDSNPNNQYVFVKDTFKVKDENVIALEFINKESSFEITNNSCLEEFKLKKYLDQPRKLKPSGEIDTETYLIVLENKFEVNPIRDNRLYLLVKDSNERIQL